jgi:MFS family permease
MQPSSSAPTGPPVGLAARLGPFRHRPFAVYWAGGLVSNLGTWLQTVAGSIFVYQLTGSALAVGLLNFAGFLPIFLFSVAGGVVSDRFDRRTIVIWSHVVSGLLAAALALVTFAGLATEIHLVVVFFALNTAYAIAKPSIIAILPGLVPRDEVTDAVGLNTLQFILGQVSGPIIAAIVMATAGAGWAFTINALTYLGPILSMLYLRRRGLGARQPVPTGADRPPAVSVGSFVRDQPWVLRLLVGIVAVSAPLEVIRTLSPAIVVEGLREPESTAGLIVAAQSVGSALALAVFVPMRRRGWSQHMVSLGLLLQAVGLAGAAAAPSLGVAVVSVALVGFGFSLCFPVLTGTLQLEVPDSLRGRIMAFHQTAHLGNRPLTALLFGGLATLVGAQPAVVAGAVLAPIGLLATRRAWQLLGSGRAEPAATSFSTLDGSGLDAVQPDPAAAARSASAAGTSNRGT